MFKQNNVLSWFKLTSFSTAALEAELRSLRKGAVELEEQNAVLSSHIDELTDVVKELRNAKAIMQVRGRNKAAVLIESVL